jgi:type II restriction enzyme
MDLSLQSDLADRYSSPAQKARVLTEHWVWSNAFCPNCGGTITQYQNNQPVADFFCSRCEEDYELKSKNGPIGQKIVDGAYQTMIGRLDSDKNPSFFFLSYDKAAATVSDFLVIPKHFFVPSIIEKRKPLAPTARRAGWVGCNILLNSIPNTGKIFLVRNRNIEPKERVLAEWKKTLFLGETKDVSAKGWLLNVMHCVDKIGKSEFSLQDVYALEDELSRIYPGNKHIREKIRQQLQVLRDKGYLDFVARGLYRLS